MHYDYKTENQRAQSFVKNLSLTLKPEEAVLVDALKESSQHASGDHYTFSCLVPQELRERIEPITKELAKVDPTLILNPPELYHLTVFWCSIHNDIDNLISIVKEAIKEAPLSFQLHGLIAAPFGISLKAYPLGNGFVELRKKLYPATGQNMPLNPDGSYHERAVSTWITLARYARPITRQTLDYVNSRLDDDFGTFTPEAIGAYISNNKFLRDPRTIEIVPNAR